MMYVGCSKCGTPIEVEEQAVKNAIVLGHELTISHDVCPGEEPPPSPEPPKIRRFRAQLMICEVPVDEDGEVTIPAPQIDGVPLELIAGLGRTVDAPNAGKAVNGPLTLWLNEAWTSLQDSIGYADVPAPSPATES